MIKIRFDGIARCNCCKEKFLIQNRFKSWNCPKCNNQNEYMCIYTNTLFDYDKQNDVIIENLNQFVHKINDDFDFELYHLKIKLCEIYLSERFN